MAEFHPVREGLSIRCLTTQESLFLRGASAQTLRLRLKEKTGLDAFKELTERAVLVAVWQVVFLTDGLDVEEWLKEPVNPATLESATTAAIFNALSDFAREPDEGN